MSPSGFMVFFFFFRSYYTDPQDPSDSAAERSGAGCWSLLDILPMACSGSLWMMGCRGSPRAPVSMGWHWNEPCGSRRWDGLEIPIEMGISSSLCRAGSTSGTSRGPLADGRELNALGCVLLPGVPHSVPATWSAEWELGARLVGELSAVAYCPCFCSMQTLQAPSPGLAKGWSYEAASWGLPPQVETLVKCNMRSVPLLPVKRVP